MFKFSYKYYLLLCYLSLFSFVNIEYFHFSYAYYESSSLSNNLKFIRSLFPLVLIAQFFIFLIYVFINKKKLFYDYYLFFLFIYLILQSIGLFLSYNNPNFNIFYIFISLATILVFFQINQLERNDLNLFVHLCLFILFILFILFFSQNIILFFQSHLNFYSEFPLAFRSDTNPQLINPNLGLQKIEDLDQKIKNFTIYQTILGEIPPRSSGISRIALILSTFLFLILIKKNKFNTIFFLLLIYLNFSIFISQSRLNVVSILLIYFFIIYFSKKNFSSKVSNLIILLLLPFLIASYLNYSKSERIFPFKNLPRPNSDSEISKNIDRLDNATREKHIFTLTGREKIWSDIFQFTKPKWYIGNGPQADRYTVGQSSSNLLFYAYSSGGFFSVLIFISFYVKIFLTLKKIILIKGINYIMKDTEFSFSILILSYLLFRSLFETSFGVFGLDLILFLILLLILKKKSISLK
jgi:hypothetical protein